MFAFDCPHCQEPVRAMRHQAYTTCETCGERLKVPDVAEVKTLTPAELKALRSQAAAS